MAWYDPAWVQRHAVMTSRSANGILEHSWTVQKHMDHFWDNLADQTDAFDVVVTEADGLTLVPAFDYSGTFDFATKTMTIRWNSAVATGMNIHVVFWIYWAKDAPASMVGAPTTVAPVEVVSSLIDPTTGRFVVQQGPSDPGATTLRPEIAATPVDQFLTWVQVPTTEISTSLNSANDSDKLYEVARFDYQVDSGGVNQFKDTPANNRIVEDNNGVTWFGVFTSALVVDTDYTAVIHADVAAPGEPTQALYSRHKIQCTEPVE